MEEVIKEFKKFLENEDKENAVNYILEKVKNKEIEILDLYSYILEPSLNSIICTESEKLCVWREHVRSSIVRTIIECCYPYVINIRNSINLLKNKKAIVLCPNEETHEIGARIVTDVFTICGYDAMFVGANTPKSDFIDVINHIKPYYLAISVTNYYNVFSAKKIISEIRQTINFDLKIMVGGNAFRNNQNLYKEIGADISISNGIKELITKI